MATSNLLKKLSLATAGAVALAVGTMVEKASAAAFFDSVISFTPGNGSGVFSFPNSPYQGPTGEGTFDPSAVTALDLASLALGGASGTPGSIVLGFSDGGSVFDGAGTDLIIYDSFGLSEGFKLDVSNDGASWFEVGTLDGSTAVTEALLGGTTYATSIDIASAGLSLAKFIRITAAPFSVFAFPEAYDLDAAKALNFSPNTISVPEPASALSLLAFGALSAGSALKRKQQQKA